jgi:hypothetical protein
MVPFSGFEGIPGPGVTCQVTEPATSFFIINTTGPAPGFRTRRDDVSIMAQVGRVFIKAIRIFSTYELWETD